MKTIMSEEKDNPRNLDLHDVVIDKNQGRPGNPSHPPILPRHHQRAMPLSLADRMGVRGLLSSMQDGIG
jgi:hypothetical protein